MSSRPAILLISADGALAGSLGEAMRGDADFALLHHAGLRATISLITTGALSPEAVKGYGEVILARNDGLPKPDRLLQRFAEAGISSTPFAYAIDPTGEMTLPLIEADPHAKDAKPVMTDTDWVALQGICDG